LKIGSIVAWPVTILAQCGQTDAKAFGVQVSEHASIRVCWREWVKVLAESLTIDRPWLAVLPSRAQAAKNFKLKLAKGQSMPRFGGSTVLENMTFNPLDAWLAMAPSASPTGTAPDPKGEMIKMLGMFAIMGFIFYFLLIRPQRQRAKQQETMLKAIKAGDKIVTSSGILGVVIAVKDKSVSIRSADTKLEILKSAVSEITERAGEPSPS
jgi:preprotein translocase subunit YajC